MSWSTIHLRVTTPLFNAGHDPVGDQDTGIRVPSILGAMRFWFRAMAGAHLGPDLAALRYWEARVFGRAASDATGGRDDAAAPIQWRIPKQPPVTSNTVKPPWLPSFGIGKAGDQGDDRWLVYLLGQGLGDLRNCKLNRSYVEPGKPFELRFRQRHNDPQALGLALTSLWLTCAFGGVGARTRRGFGTLEIIKFEPNGVELLPPWDDTTDFAIPADALYPSLTRIATKPMGRSLPLFQNAPEEHRKSAMVYRWEAMPPYPVIGLSPATSGRETTTAGLGTDTFSSWNEALQAAGYMSRMFRASENTPGVPYWPQVKTPEWLDTVNGGSDQFALGALGLPIVFKKDCSVNVLIRGEEARRASPLWIRPVRVGDCWRLFSFTFLSQFLPPERHEDFDIQVLRDKNPSKQVIIPPTALEDLSLGWLRRIGARPPAGEV
jgi:CRISPR-associated protein Cmr1